MTQCIRMLAFLLISGLLMIQIALAKELTLRPFVSGSAAAITNANASKPFVLAFWSVNCVHCRAELAMLGKLGKQYPDLNIVLVATDSIEESAVVAAVLRQYPLEQAESWVFADDFVERLHFEVDRQWRGELPRTYLYAPDAAVIAVTGKMDPQKLVQWAANKMGGKLARH